MSSLIGCSGLIAIFIFILLLGLLSRQKRKEVSNFYQEQSLFTVNDPPAQVRELIGATDPSCLQGALTTDSGSRVPFYWWEWFTSSTNFGGGAPVTSISSFLAISFPPNVVSEEFERFAEQSIQSNAKFSQKLKDGFILNTRDPLRTARAADGSFVIFWQIKTGAGARQEKLAWLRLNLARKPDIIKPEIMETIFNKHDNYAALQSKFSEAWPNLTVELHHSGGKLDKEGRDEFGADAAFADLAQPNAPMFALSDETIVQTAMNLFSDHCAGEAVILRDGVSVENQESLAYCNNPFKLPLNEYTYGEFKRRFEEHWPNLIIELYDAAPRTGGLRREAVELPDNFEMKNLKHAEKAFLHDYMYISSWGELLTYIRIAAAIKNKRLGVYYDGQDIYQKLKDFQAK